MNTNSSSNFVVYFIETLDGRVYIGYTKNHIKRWRAHLNQLRNHRHHNIHLQRVYDEYGESFIEFKVFEKYTNELEARNREEYLILYFFEKAIDLLLNIGKKSCGGNNLTNNHKKEEIISKRTQTVYKNMAALTKEERRIRYGKSGSKNGMYGKTHTKGARESISKKNLGISRNVGLKRSTETKKKMSDLAKTRTGNKNPFFGKHHSEEFKQKLSQTMKSKHSLPPNSLKVSCEGKEYFSLAEAGRDLGVCGGAIAFRIKSKYFPTYFKIIQEMPNDHPEKE